MSLAISWRPEAREEFDEAFDWCQRKRAGLGIEFMARVQEALDCIETTPLGYSLVTQDVRQCVIQHFPYSIFYRTEPNQIVVLAVFHARREPKIWQERT